MCDKFQEIKKQLLTQVESQMAHLECVDTGRDMAKFLGYKVETLEEFDEYDLY